MKEGQTKMRRIKPLIIRMREGLRNLRLNKTRLISGVNTHSHWYLSCVEKIIK
jgi:hypothetical protein